MPTDVLRASGFGGGVPPNRVGTPPNVKFLLVFPASTVSSLRIAKHPRIHHAAVKKGVMRLIIFFWFRPLRPHPETTSDL